MDRVWLTVITKSGASYNTWADLTPIDINVEECVLTYYMNGSEEGYGTKVTVYNIKAVGVDD